MTDIVERLRILVEDETGAINRERREAADEIERLRAALEWFADQNNYIDCAVETDGYIRARTALQKDDGE